MEWFHSDVMGWFRPCSVQKKVEERNGSVFCSVLESHRGTEQLKHDSLSRLKSTQA
jgi:hypothetical protein